MVSSSPSAATTRTITMMGMLILVLVVATASGGSDADPKGVNGAKKVGGDIGEASSPLAPIDEDDAVIDVADVLESSSSLSSLEEDGEEPKGKRDRMREYWRRTFEEIKASNPVVFPTDKKPPFSSSSSTKKIDRWKLESSLLSSSSKSAWDEKLQTWADDVKVYMKKLPGEAPNGGEGYDMSSFGGPFKSLRKKAATVVSVETSVNGSPPTSIEAQSGTNGNVGMDVGDTTTETEGTSDTNVAIVMDTDMDADKDVGINLGTDDTIDATQSKQKDAPFSPPLALAALEPDLPFPPPRPVTPDDEIVPHTDISDKSKNIWIVTTAAIPWTTGTAVNPLLRAAYLSSGRKAAGGSVTLMLPWVERPSDQERIYGKEKMFESAEDQEEYIRTWLRDTANMPEAAVELDIRWFTAWQEVLENSLYPMGDIIALIPEPECDICVLEEPEHLNWYRAPGENWTQKFKHVVGIIHTNYFVYAQEQPAALIRAPGMRLLCSWMCRAHCHRVIKLSGTLDQFAPEKELIENVHGVRSTFLDVGKELRLKLPLLPSSSGVELSSDDASPSSLSSINEIFAPDATPAVYFIGKMLWSKGLAQLMDLVKYAEESAGLRVKVDMYGGGPNKDEARTKSEGMGLDMPFHGPLDHAQLGWTHKIFINPSLSEVLCTTVAEALAMGKFVVLPSHPSNDFFAQFPNCLPYTNEEEFVGNLYYALTHSPEPMSEEYSRALSWEAATERFAAAGSVSVAEATATEEALLSADAGLDIALPALIQSEEQRKQISRSFRRTRQRYRNFRAGLSQEISKNDFLPKDLQQRLVADLDRRLNVDLDEFLATPKLRVKLSPAKLDALLLELYDGVSEGPRGDILRVIGGGADVGRQHRYVLDQQQHQQQQQKIGFVGHDELESTTTGPTVMHREAGGSDDVLGHVVGGQGDLRPTSVVKRALNRNLPPDAQKLHQQHANGVGGGIKETSRTKQKGPPTMSLHSFRSGSRMQIEQHCSWGSRRAVHRGSFSRCHVPSRPRFSPLI